MKLLGKKTNMILLSQLILNLNFFAHYSPSLLSKKHFREKNQNYPPTIPGDFYLFRRHCRFNFLIIRRKTEDTNEKSKRKTPRELSEALLQEVPREVIMFII